MFSRLHLMRLAVASGLFFCMLRPPLGQEQHLGKPVPIHYLTQSPIRVDKESVWTFSLKPTPPLREDEAVRLVDKISAYTNSSLSRNTEIKGTAEELIFFSNQKDASSVLRVSSRTRDVLFSKGLTPYRGEGDTPGLVGEEEAPRAALEHLKALGLLPPQHELVLAHVGGLNMGVHQPDGTTHIYRKLITVRFDRKLGTFPVFGSSRMVVQLGEKGALAGLVSRWVPADGRKVSIAELRSDEEIRESVEKHLRSDAGDATEILVKQTDLVLFDHGANVIEPAIHVVGNMHYEVKVSNSRIKGEVRRLDVPFDSFEPVLTDHKAVYPFMRDPNAIRLIKKDQGVKRLGTEPTDGEPQQ